MGLSRGSRRRIVTISSDEEDEATQDSPSQRSKDDEDVKFKGKATGKLKPVNKSVKSQDPTPTPSPQETGSQRSPTKTRTAKSKSKTAVKDQPKPNGRTIYSFFNTAAQRQQSSQPAGSPEKLSTPQEEPEAIFDDSEDEAGSGVQLAKGSSTALAMRKRKVQSDGAFARDSSLPPPASQKFRKVSSGDRLPSLSVKNEDTRPWTDQFAPNDLSELAVHKRKVTDVRQWLETTLSGRRQKVLVLKGAAGTGKTTTVRLLARELGLDVTEWKNPAGAEMSAEGSASATAQFDDFVSRAGRSGGLEFTTSDEYDTIRPNEDERPSTTHSGILLIEEFPNTFSRSSSALQSFRSALLQYLASAPLNETKPTPIILIISETLLSTNTALADSFTAHRLLGPELANHPFLDTIEFNSVALTFLTKALETIVLKEARKSGRRRTPGPQVLKHIAESGDIRSAVSALEFLCLRGDDGDIWSSKVTFTKQKKAKSDPPLTQSEQDALKLITNRESTLGIFHAVGKVVYNKRVESRTVVHPPGWLPEHRRNQVPENDPDQLIDELGTDISTFVAALHENYVLSCSSSSAEDALDSLTGCMNDISDADLLSVDRFSYGTRAFSGSATDSLRQDEMAFQVAVRGLSFHLPFPVHRSAPADGKRGDAFRLFYPSSLKLWRKREEIEEVLDLLSARLHNGSLVDSSQTHSANIGGGVEGWKRNSNLDASSLEREAINTNLQMTSSAKKELLLECLPYIARTLSARSVSSKVTEQLNAVTRVRGSAPVEDGDEDDANEEGEAVQEQWATDRPDTETSGKNVTGRAKPKQNRPKITDERGLPLPVESGVQNLVLEDDDIVDD